LEIYVMASRTELGDLFGSKTPYINEIMVPEQLVSISNPFVIDKNGNTETDGMGPDEHKQIVKNIKVQAPLPEAITFSIGNEVNETFDFFKIKSKLIQTFGGSANLNFDRGISERQYWRSIINQEFTIEMKFDAYYSGKVDVVLPIKRLLLMASPVENNAFGGTVIKDLDAFWSGPPRVNVAFGSLIKFSSVWIKNVTPTFSNKLDNNFDPMSATVSVTLITQDPVGYRNIFTDMKYDL